jgi:hypothetical protein
MAGIDVSGFNVPETPYREDNSLYKLSESMMQRRRFEYQLQRQKEEDEWRKLNLIQDLTDLSKHQTASDIVNAIGNQHAADVLQKYTVAAKNMSPAELQGKISQEMSGVINGMGATKNELDLADKQVAAIKQQFPDLDISSLAKDYRSDILNRRLKNDKEFVNPIEVQPSQFQIGNPEFLSHYVTGDKNLRTYFQNPQGLDETSVFRGNPNSYTKFTAKIPPWKKPNFNPESLKGGFMPSGQEPQLQFKSETLPSDALPSSNGRPFEMMSKDAYNDLTGKEQLELIAKTRKQFPTYDQMNNTEREYAQRHVLLNTAKAFDQTNFHPTEVHTPSASLLKLWMGGNEKDASLMVNDIYHRVDNALTDRENQGQKFLPASILPPDAKDVIVKQAQTKDKDLTEDDLQIIRGNDGSLRVFDKNGDFVNYVQRVASNIKAQPSVKEKREVIKQGNVPTTTKSSKYLIKGKTYSEKELLDMGYSLDQIKQYKQ